MKISLPVGLEPRRRPREVGRPAVKDPVRPGFCALWSASTVTLRVPPARVTVSRCHVSSPKAVRPARVSFTSTSTLLPPVSASATSLLFPGSERTHSEGCGACSVPTP